MSSSNTEKFVIFLAENKEAQAKAKDLRGDVDALAVYARELGFEFSPEELREMQEVSRRLFETRLKKGRQPGASPSPGAQAFCAMLELAETDSQAAKELEALIQGTRAELIAYGREKGFIFDEADLDAVGKYVLQPTEELNDDELELVAGGTTLALIGLGLGAFILAVAFTAGFIAAAFMTVELHDKKALFA